jgi:hypothetical protein
MVEERNQRRKYITVEAVNPQDGKNFGVQICYQRIQAVGRRSKGQAMECGRIVPAISQSPKAIFEGLMRDEDEDRKGYGWLCYCGIPEKACHTDGSERRAYPGQVFLVFVNDERVAYNWRWEKADIDNPHLPENHEERFKRRSL